MAKILYSPGYGAGWSTWNSGTPEFNKWLLTYQPIIDALERGEKLVPDNMRYEIVDHATGSLREEMHPALRQLVREAVEKFGEEHVCVLGADDLEVTEVDGPFRVEECDGNESIVQDGPNYWTVL